MINFVRAMSSSRGASIERLEPPCGCDANPIEGLKRLFVDYFQGLSLAAGRSPATRPVFLRLHGVASGRFVVAEDLTEELRVGIFGRRVEYPAWVRFSSDVQPGTPDLNNTVGIGIKLFDVGGRKIMAPDEDATTHDFILQNHDVFFVDTVADMCEFTCLALNGQIEDYLNAYPATRRILAEMEKFVPSVLSTSYWSVVPYRFGPARYVKYKLEPEMAPYNTSLEDVVDPHYLRADLHSRLGGGEARFRFLVQFQTDDDEMPLDRATVRWCEDTSVPIHVGTLILPQQDLDARNQSTYGENLAINPWHALPDHEPVGSISAARKVVYAASANIRRHFNGVPLGEPTEPRPQEWAPGVPFPAGHDAEIVRAAIHPAIGVARLGTSAEHFIGPEVISLTPDPSLSYRDSTGALKRQAARFRIYGYNAAGQVVRELSPDDAIISWTAHVANRKAAWFQWTMALDVPEAAGSTIHLRNANVSAQDRGRLIIDGGSKTISGRGVRDAAYEFVGQFQGTPVSLGEVQTDDEGRLVFLSGLGKSASPTDSPIFDPTKPNPFINADGWYDDICDGPITASVTIDGRDIPVEGAWLVTAPPNYAPHILGVRTLYDLLVDLYIQANWMQFAESVSFREHVYPILQRLSNLQWTNRGFAAQFGRSAPYDFADEDFVAKLARDPRAHGVDTYAALRRQILNQFRDPQGEDSSFRLWPWIYGDAMDEPPADTPRQHAAVSQTQYQILQLWAAGEFVPDWSTPGPSPPTRLSQVPLGQQPQMLDRAALEFCLADAFHPGCEVTWPIRHLSMFSAPFRIRRRPRDAPEPNYGPTLTPHIALSPTGPLVAQGPGDLTKWMGLPWQADTAFCQSGYHVEDDPYIPSFWPARVPNHVLTDANYQIAVDGGRPRDSRLAAFADRYRWNDPLTAPSTSGQMKQMVDIYGDMALLESRPGVLNDPHLPEQMMVATFGPSITEPPGIDARGPALTGAPFMLHEPTPPKSPEELLSQQAARLAGFASQKESNERPIPVQRPRRLPQEEIPRR